MNLARLRWPLIVGAILGFAVLTYLALSAPLAARLAAPLTQKIFYFHVPAAAAAYAAFAVTLAGCLRVLWKGDAFADRWAAASAEVGVVLTSISLFTGILWSRVEFFSVSTAGSSADFTFALLGDAKFVTTAALWLTFVGYLALRRSVQEEERRARLASVFGVAGFLGVPLSYVSSRFSPHPDFLTQGSGLSPALGAILGVGMVVFLVVYAALFVTRVEIGERLHAARAARAQAEREREANA